MMAAECEPILHVEQCAVVAVKYLLNSEKAEEMRKDALPR